MADGGVSMEAREMLARLLAQGIVPQVEGIPQLELPRRMREETLTFLRLYAADRGDRAAGEEPISDAARCDLCGLLAPLGRLFQSAHMLTWTVLSGPLVVVRPVPAERAEDGQFWLCRRCWPSGIDPRSPIAETARPYDTGP
jgi:hypothetical protein